MKSDASALVRMMLTAPSGTAESAEASVMAQHKICRKIKAPTRGSAR